VLREFSQLLDAHVAPFAGEFQTRHGCALEEPTPSADSLIDCIRCVQRIADLELRGETMSEKIQSDQRGSGVQKDQKPTDEQRRQQQRGEKPKVGEQHETGSSSNSQPGSGPG
jgi:hypothetical protein